MTPNNEKQEPRLRFVNPLSDEVRVAIYNAEHTDSAMQIHYLPITEGDYDGSTLRYGIGYDPFDVRSICSSAFSIWDKKKQCLYFGRDTNKGIAFRLPRRLKKRIKKHYSGSWTKQDARFFLECFKTSRYYGTKILKEIRK